MKKVSLIGDCHSNRLMEFWSPECPVDLTIWGRGGQQAWGFEPEKTDFLKIYSSKLERSPIFSIEDIRDQFTIPFNKIEDEGLIFLWLGYVDSKLKLPEFNDIELCVDLYLNRIKKYFKKAKIKIIEPFPQFIPYIGIKEEKNIEWPYKKRKKCNDQFIFYLNKKCKELDIEIAITQEEIFKKLGFGPDEMSFKNAKIGIEGLFMDTFEPYNMKKIYDLIISKALE